MLIRHRDSNRTISINPTAFDAYEPQGWIPVLPTPTPVEVPAPDGPVVEQEEPAKAGPKVKEKPNG